MYPFQFWCEQNQRIEFHFDRWRQFKDELFDRYPVDRHTRLELSLHSPSDRLRDVRVHDWNPHHAIGNYHLSVHDCFYSNSNWSTIFDGAYPYYDQNIKVFVEYGHENPWGEPFILMSTASDIFDDSCHRYAYYRGKYWKVSSFINHSRPSWFDMFIAGEAILANNFRWAVTIHSASFGLDRFDKFENWIKEGF